MVEVGIDWAEDHHDVAVLDEQGQLLTSRRIPQGVEGLAWLHAMVAEHAEDPAQVMVGVETDRGLLVGALVAAGYQACAVNPRAVDRYRDRHGQAGATSDAGGARVLADLVRTDRHQHRRVAGDGELVGRSRPWPAATRAWSGPVSGSPTSCAARCGSSTRPRWPP